jgi:XTP/dITP diphosphohydrolase
MISKKIVLASSNRTKLREINYMAQAFNGPSFSIDLVDQSNFRTPDARETGTTFVENAIIKARHACHYSDLPAIADDSGLIVDALGYLGPGVRTSRYAGEHATKDDNIKKLLTAMLGIPSAQRIARLVSVVVYMRDANDPCPIITTGVWEGSIGYIPQGMGGSCFDSIFWPFNVDCSVAQLTVAELAVVSHRGIAISEMFNHIKEECK